MSLEKYHFYNDHVISFNTVQLFLTYNKFRTVRLIESRFRFIYERRAHQVYTNSYLLSVFIEFHCENFLDFNG